MSKDFTKLEGLATPKQLFALFCATKQDFRNKGLTRQQASDMLKAANESKPKPLGEKTAVQIMAEALEAGKKAMDACMPTPMVVAQHTDMLNDNSPIAESWYIPSGACGFAWISFKANTPQNRGFLSGLKKARLVGEYKAWYKSWDGGYSYWVSLGGQSMELKEAYARAFAKVLNTYGITAYSIKEVI